MRITNYEAADLLVVDAFLQKHPTLDNVTVKELLKTCNVSFVLEEINRWQSTMICELKDSYVQQSPLPILQEHPDDLHVHAR